MEDDNDILIEDVFVDDISLNGGVSGTTSVLVDAAALFGKRALNKINFKINTGPRETHELFWMEDFVQVTNSSNVSDPEIIHKDKLRKYDNNDLFVSVISIFKSLEPALWLKEGGDYEPVAAPIAGMSSKATYYLAALHNLLI